MHGQKNIKFWYVSASRKIFIIYEWIKSNVTLGLKVSNYVKIYLWKDENI